MEPALPLDEAGRYVAAAYIIFLGLIGIYVAIMAVRISRLKDQVAELAELAERRRDEGERAGTKREREEVGS